MSNLSPEKEVISASTDHHRETHGMRKDINDMTPLEDVRAPNMLERVKEEVEALIETIQTKKESPKKQPSGEEDRPEKHNSGSDHEVRTPKFIEKAKETIGKIIHQERKLHHRSETHGMSDDIDENTPVDEVKAPNVFERAKEEFEAIFQSIHPPKVDN